MSPNKFGRRARMCVGDIYPTSAIASNPGCRAHDGVSVTRDAETGSGDAPCCHSLHRTYRMELTSVWGVRGMNFLSGLESIIPTLDAVSYPGGC